MSLSRDLFHSGGGINSSILGHNKLCFEPNEFHSESFSIDEFIQRKRQVVPLDILRDDLGYYLKSLRSALIELINHDYGQFVNLSSNLVGLDSQIYNIVKPLKVVQRDLEGLRDHLDETLKGLYNESKQKKTFHGIKSHLQYLRLANTTLESTEYYLRHVSPTTYSTGEISIESFRHLQLVCSEVAQAQFLLQKCINSSTFIRDSGSEGTADIGSIFSCSTFLQQMHSRYETCSKFICDKLETLLEVYGNYVVDSSQKINNEDIETKVKLLLHMYYELKQERRAEELFVAKVLRPKCTEILSRKGNVMALLDETEVFLTKCPILIVSNKIQVWPWLAQYNFITNGLFPCIISIFMKQFPHIWSPSNPEQFFLYWNRFETFIQKVEDCLPSIEHLNQFRSSNSLSEFMGKWQFHVYFQLRFHNLAIELESALDYLVTSPCATSDFKLDATRVLVKVVSQCWDNEKIFITQLAGRFLKASALFVARYLKEISSQIKHTSDSIKVDDKNNATIKQSDNSSSSPIPAKLQLLTNIYYDVNLSELVLGQILQGKIETIISSQLEIIHPSEEDILKTQEPPHHTITAVDFLTQFQWESTKQSIQDHLIQIILSEMIIHISAVNEVPRLFRRTNREIPTRHSDYIDTMLQPLLSFETIIGSKSDSGHTSTLWNTVVKNVGRQLAERYANQVQDVITSVQRMEESLKRLKKVKAGSGVVNNAMNNSTKISDDDKIRRQIQLDVEYLITRVFRRKEGSLYEKFLNITAKPSQKFVEMD